MDDAGRGSSTSVGTTDGRGPSTSVGTTDGRGPSTPLRSGRDDEVGRRFDPHPSPNPLPSPNPGRRKGASGALNRSPSLPESGEMPTGRDPSLCSGPVELIGAAHDRTH